MRLRGDCRNQSILPPFPCWFEPRQEQCSWFNASHGVPKQNQMGDQIVSKTTKLQICDGLFKGLRLKTTHRKHQLGRVHFQGKDGYKTKVADTCLRQLLAPQTNWDHIKSAAIFGMLAPSCHANVLDSKQMRRHLCSAHRDASEFRHYVIAACQQIGGQIAKRW